MPAFNLYRADCIGNEWNCSYPHAVNAGDEESLRQAVCQDYVAVEYRKDISAIVTKWDNHPLATAVLISVYGYLEEKAKAVAF